MKRMKDKHGGSYITPCVYVIVITMILSVILFYAHAMTAIETTKENMQMVLDSFIMKNSVEIYDSIKQGNNHLQNFDENYCFSEYSSRFSLDFYKNSLYNVSEDGETVYTITDPHVTYKLDKTLNLKVSYTLLLPVRLAGKTIYQLNIPLSVSSGLTLKE